MQGLSRIVSAFVLLAPVLAHAEQRVGVLEVKVESVEPALGRQLTARLAEVIGRRPNVRVIAPDDIRAMLEQEAKKQLLGCDDDSCLAEIAGALGVDLIVQTRLARIDDAFAVSMSAVDANTAEGKNHVTERWGGPSIALLELVPPMVDKLFSPAGELAVGELAIVGAIDGSQVFLDDDLRGTAPTGVMKNVPVGAHRVRLSFDEYLPLEVWVVVNKGRTTEVPVRQEQEPSEPVYATWWFWTIAVAGLAGAATGTALALSSDGTPTDMPPAQTGVNVGVNADSAFGR